MTLDEMVLSSICENKSFGPKMGSEQCIPMFTTCTLTRLFKVVTPAPGLSLPLPCLIFLHSTHHLTYHTFHLLILIIISLPHLNCERCSQTGIFILYFLFIAILRVSRIVSKCTLIYGICYKIPQEKYIAK